MTARAARTARFETGGRRSTARAAAAARLASLLIVLLAGCGPERRAAPADEHGHDAGHAEHGTHGAAEPGVVVLRPEAVTGAAIETGHAGPRRIEIQIETPGEIRMNAERVVEIRPRFAGVVRRLGKQLGQIVSRGEVIASVHSNESLSEYAITAPLAGTVVAREASVGQAVDHDDRLYTIADLASVWVDFAIYPQNVASVRRGQRVRIVPHAGTGPSAEGTIHYVGPLLEQDTRVSYGRVVLPNRDGRWQPGLYVNTVIVVSTAEVPVAVPEEAIVRMLEGPAVFRVERPGTFHAQPVVTGRSDGTFTEITQGLEANTPIVVKNAFLLKAELGKSEATHEH